MAVRAKFECKAKFAEDPLGEIIQVRFEAVYGDGTDNAEWSKWTPSGELRMQITNKAASDQFEVGKTYFFDITSAG